MRLLFLASAIFVTAIAVSQVPAVANDAEGLEIGQMGSVNGQVKLRISNLSQKSSDVVFWVVDGNSRYCERVTSIDARKYADLGFYCEYITPQSKIRIGYAWADRVPRIAAVAKRLD